MASTLTKSRPSSVPARWHQRLARLVARRAGVQLIPSRALAEGKLGNAHLSIHCAKSKRAAISVSKTVLERVNEVWCVFLDENDNAEVWRFEAKDFRRVASFYSPKNGSPLWHIGYKRCKRAGELVQTVPHSEVDAIEIP